MIFVDGASTDGTRARILEQIERHRGRLDIKLIDQVPARAGAPGCRKAPRRPGGPRGGGDRRGGEDAAPGQGRRRAQGFAARGGTCCSSWTPTSTVPPEDLPKFLRPIATGEAGFVNGTRLVYPLEDEAMRTGQPLREQVLQPRLTWLLDQRIKDTLCGTKVLRKRDYDDLAANRGYFEDFDPFGDFDLLFGAARLELPIVEVPVRYRRRTSGQSKVQVYKHGLLLLRMSAIGFRRLKLQRWIENRAHRPAQVMPSPSRSASSPSPRWPGPLSLARPGWTGEWRGRWPATAGAGGPAGRTAAGGRPPIPFSPASRDGPGPGPGLPGPPRAGAADRAPLLGNRRAGPPRAGRCPTAPGRVAVAGARGGRFLLGARGGRGSPWPRC